MNFKLSRKEKSIIISEIQRFFYEERDEEIGLIAADIIFDFFSDSLGNFIYNKGLDDAKLWFSKRMDDLSIDYDSLYK